MKESLEKLIASLPDKLQARPQQTLSLSAPRTLFEVDPDDTRSDGYAPVKGDFDAITIAYDPQTNPELAAEVRGCFDKLVELQASRDQTADQANLRRLMQEALNKSSDKELLEFLQLKKEELPEALEGLREALKDLRRRKEEQELVKNREDLSSQSDNVFGDESGLEPGELRGGNGEEDLDVDIALVEQIIKALGRKRKFF